MKNVRDGSPPMESSVDRCRAGALTYTAFLDHQDHLCTDTDLNSVVQAAREALNRGRARAVNV